MIRPLQPADADAAAGLIRAAFSSIAEALDPAPSALRETGASVLVQLAGGGGAVWADTMLAGVVLWRVQEGGLYLCRLAVDPARRREGIAQALIAAAEMEARRSGQPRVHLGVRLALVDNRRLFAKAGFRETNLRTHEGYPAPTWVEAEKRLQLSPASSASTASSVASS